MELPIYLDYNSTTPVDPRVLDAMLPYFSEKFGNPASRSHQFGWITADAVEQAREKVAQLINSESNEIIFTSGSTEAINLALKGTFEVYNSKRNQIITFETEHKAVLDTCNYLKQKGAEIVFLPVGFDGTIDLIQFKKAVSEKTLLVSAMYANNETGVIHPIKEIAKIAHDAGALYFTDATQAIGKINVDVADGIDMLCLSAHKFYGPKGSGALYVRRKNPRVNLSPVIHGGGHEKNLRSGTLNVPGIVGLGKACEIAEKEMWDDNIKISSLRTKLEQHLLDIGNVYVNGSQKHRLSNVTNLSFENLNANDFIKEFSEIAVSTGSACTSALSEPSHVLKAMGVSNDLAYSSIRFSLGKYTTEEEIDFVISRIQEVFERK